MARPRFSDLHSTYGVCMPHTARRSIENAKIYGPRITNGAMEKPLGFAL